MTELKVGDKAPSFAGKDQNGSEVSSDALRGKRIILYFYPKDNTPGCTAEACSLRDGKRELGKMGFVIIGVSPDSEASHKKFTEKHSLNFSLLPDTDREIAKAYGVYRMKKFMGRESMGIIRTTFIIDAQGNIEKIFDKVNTKNHFEQIADLYK